MSQTKKSTVEYCDFRKFFKKIANYFSNFWNKSMERSTVGGRGEK
jgi:hypothetical protein